MRIKMGWLTICRPVAVGIIHNSSYPPRKLYPIRIIPLYYNDTWLLFILPLVALGGVPSGVSHNFNMAFRISSCSAPNTAASVAYTLTVSVRE